MITLAFSVLVYYFFSQVTQLSGFGGVNNVDLPGLVGDPVQDPAPLYLVTLAAAVLVFLALRGIARTPFGLSLQGVRDEPARMRALGFNVDRHRVLAFGLAALVAAIAGVFSVWYNRRISPGSINLGQTIDVLIIAVDRRPVPARGRVGRSARLRADRQLLARVDPRGRQRPRPGSLQHDHRTRLPGHRPRLSERPAGPLGAGGRSPAKTADVGGSRGPPRDRHCQLKGSRGEVFCIQES